MTYKERDRLAHRARTADARAEAYQRALTEASRYKVLSAQYFLNVDIAESKYGDHGPLVACVVRDHFPDGVKAELRALAFARTDAGDRSYVAWRQSGRQSATFRAFWNEVMYGRRAA
jgi:hypothetical protein